MARRSRRASPGLLAFCAFAFFLSSPAAAAAGSGNGARNHQEELPSTVVNPETMTPANSLLWAADHPTSEQTIALSELQPAWTEASSGRLSGSAAAASAEAGSKRFSVSHKLPAVRAAVAAATATLLATWLFAMRGVRKQAAVVGPVVISEAGDAVAGPPVLYQPGVLHKLSAVANRLCVLLDEPGSENLAKEVTERVQKAEKSYAAIQDLAHRQEVDLTSLTAMKQQFNMQVEALEFAIRVLSSQVLQPVHQLVREAADMSEELSLEAEAARLVVKAAPRDFAVAQSAFAGLFAVEAEEKSAEIGKLAVLIESMASKEAANLKEGVELLELIMKRFSRVKQLSTHVKRDANTIASWKLLASEACVKEMRMEGSSLRARIETLGELVALDNLTPEAAAAAADYSDSVEAIQVLYAEAPTWGALIQAKPAALAAMLEQLRMACGSADDEAGLLLTCVRERLQIPDDKDDSVLYNEDASTLESFSTLAVLHASLANDCAIQISDLMDAMTANAGGSDVRGKEAAQRALAHAVLVRVHADEARAAGEKAEEAATTAEAYARLQDAGQAFGKALEEFSMAQANALYSAAWGHIGTIAYEAIAQIECSINNILSTETTEVSLHAKTTELHNRAKLLLREAERTADMKTATHFFIRSPVKEQECRSVHSSVEAELRPSVCSSPFRVRSSFYASGSSSFIFLHARTAAHAFL
ncbi:hypothetical protein Efla_003264 [Eimeria flavescens]